MLALTAQCARGQEQELKVYSPTKAEAAELLLSWMYDSQQLPEDAVLDPLLAQLWLGNNVKLPHSTRLTD